jgi:hypothetical protein
LGLLVEELAAAIDHAEAKLDGALAALAAGTV